MNTYSIHAYDSRSPAPKLRLGLGLLLALGPLLSALAHTPPPYIWDGGSGLDNLWSHQANWVDAQEPPAADGELLFPGGAVERMTNVNDYVRPIGSLTLAGHNGEYGERYDLDDALGGGWIPVLRGITNTPYTGESVLRSRFQLGAGQWFVTSHQGTQPRYYDLLTLPERLDLNGFNLTLHAATLTSTMVLGGGSFGGVQGSGNLTKTGLGTVRFVGPSANTFAGALTVELGTLELNKPAGVAVVPGAFTIGGNTGNAETVVARVLSGDAATLNPTAPLTVGLSGLLDLNGFRCAVGSLAGSGHVSLGAGALTVGANNQSTAFGGRIQGAGGLSKTGTGTLTLSGANSYTGLTRLDNGTLLLNGTLAGPVTVVGGTLAGNGAISNAVVVQAGGTLSPGASLGILTVTGPLTLAGTTRMELKKTTTGMGTSCDQVRGIGALTYGGTLSVTATGDPLTYGDTFTLFEAGSFADQFAALELPSLGANLRWDTSRLTVDGSITVRSNQVEPPVLRVIATDAFAAEPGADTATFLVVWDRPVPAPWAFRFHLEGSATEAVDYRLVMPIGGSLGGSAGAGPLTANIPAGATNYPIIVQPLDDNAVEGWEDVVLVLDPPQATPPPYVVGWPGQATAWIEDDDLPPTNQPPKVALTNPPNGSIFIGVESIRLIAVAADPDGRVRTVEFFDGFHSLGIVTNPWPPIAAVDRLPDEILAELQQALLESGTPQPYPPQVFRFLWQGPRAGVHQLTALATDNRGAQTRSLPVEVTVYDQPLPEVKVAATDPEGSEPNLAGLPDPAIFTISHNGDVTRPLTVYYRLGGTASNGLDYLELPGEVVIPAGTNSAPVRVEPLADQLIEGDETVVLTLLLPPCLEVVPPPDGCYRPARANSATVLIHDRNQANLPPFVRIVRPPDGAVFPVGTPIDIQAHAWDLDGFVVRVVFYANGEPLGAFAVGPLPVEPHLTWSNAPPGAHVLTAVATDNLGAEGISPPVHILVGPVQVPPVVEIKTIDPVAVEASLLPVIDPAVFRVARSGPTDRPLRVFYSLSGTALNEVDYHLLPPPFFVEIPAGTSFADLQALPIDDQLLEGTETILVRLEPPPWSATNTAPLDLFDNYVIGSNHLARAIILDNETNHPPTVALVQPPDGAEFEAYADLLLVAVATDPEGWVTRVEFYEGNRLLGVDAPQVVPVPPSPGVAQRFSILWSNVPPGEYVLTAKAFDLAGEAGVSAPVHVRVRAWIPDVSVWARDPFAAEAGSDPATFLVRRAGPTNDPLTVWYRFTGHATYGADYFVDPDVAPGVVTIPPGAQWAPVKIVPIDDWWPESREDVVLRLEPRPHYQVRPPAWAVAWIEDNDPAPTNQPPWVALTNPPDGAVFIGIESIPLLAVASDADGRVVTVEFFDGNLSLGTVTNPWPPIVALAETSENSGFIASELPPEWLLEPGDDPDLLPWPPRDLFRWLWQGPPAGHHVLSALATDNRGAQTRSRPVEIDVFDGPVQPPTVIVLATDPEATEPDPDGTTLDTATFTILRRGSLELPLTVWYALSGTAENGVDYTRLPQRVTIPAGTNAAPVVVVPLDDNAVEGDESVILTLLDPPYLEVVSNLTALPGNSYIVGRPHEAKAILHDNDLPPNLPPVARIVRPLDGAVFLGPLDLRIAASAFDPDGWVRTVEFFEGTRSLGVWTNSLLPVEPWLVWSNAPPGEYVLTVVATDNLGARGLSRPVRVTIVGVSVPIVVNVKVPDPQATEEPTGAFPDTATFTITRSGGLERPLRVFYSLGGTAENGVDYEPLPPDFVDLAPGAASTNLVVWPLDDRLCEGTETITLTLELPPVATTAMSGPVQEGYVIGPDWRGKAALLDNDCPDNLPPVVKIIQPANGDVFFAPADIWIFVLASDPDGWVHYVEFFAGRLYLGAVTNGPTGVSEAQQIFRWLWEHVGAQSSEIMLQARAVDNQGASSWAENVFIKVVPQMPPYVTIQATDPFATEGSVPADTATFTVRRTAPTNSDLRVLYSLKGTAENGRDYLRLSGEVVIPAGSFAKQIEVVPINDRLVEPTETIIATLEAPVCPAIYPPPPECYLVADPAQAVAYLRDNDFNQSPVVEIVNPPDHVCFLEPADITIAVVARDPDGRVLKVEFYANDTLLGVDYPDTAVYPPPAPGELQKFSLRWTNVLEGDYVLTAKATDDGGAVAWSDPVHVAVRRLVQLPVVTVVAVDPVAEEGNTGVNNTATFRVFRRGGDPTVALRVYYHLSGSASNGVDYRALPDSVVIPPQAAFADVQIVPWDDQEVEGTETIVLRLTPPPDLPSVPPSLATYLIGEPSRDLATILDNDRPNHAPVVKLINPPDGSVYVAPLDLRLVAAAEDPDGWVESVEFFDGTNSLGVVHRRPWIVEPLHLAELGAGVVPAPEPIPIPVIGQFLLMWSNVPVGLHTLTALATDNSGATAWSGPIGIVVLGTPLPLVNVMTLDGLAVEGMANTAVFRLHRRGPTNDALTVYYSLGGRAEAGVDYLITTPDGTPGLHSATIPPGHRNLRLIVQALADGQPEPPETVLLQLELPPTVPPTYEIGRPRSAGALILDSDLDAPVPGVRLLLGGAFQVHLPLPEGIPYRLEGSSDLIHWEPVIRQATSTPEGINVVEDDTPPPPYRFYRVMPETENEESE